MTYRAIRTLEVDAANIAESGDEDDSSRTERRVRFCYSPAVVGFNATVPNPNSLNDSTPLHSGAWRKAAIAFADTG